MSEANVDSTSDKNDEVLINDSVEEWIKTVEFETTKDVPIPEKMVDQVIGQEDALS